MQHAFKFIYLVSSTTVKNLSWNKRESSIFNLQHFSLTIGKHAEVLQNIGNDNYQSSRVWNIPKILIPQKGSTFLIGICEYLKAYPSTVTLLSSLTFSILLFLWRNNVSHNLYSISIFILAYRKTSHQVLLSWITFSPHLTFSWLQPFCYLYLLSPLTSRETQCTSLQWLCRTFCSASF